MSCSFQSPRVKMTGIVKNAIYKKTKVVGMSEAYREKARERINYLVYELGSKRVNEREKEKQKL